MENNKKEKLYEKAYRQQAEKEAEILSKDYATKKAYFKKQLIIYIVATFITTLLFVGTAILAYYFLNIWWCIGISIMAVVTFFMFIPKDFLRLKNILDKIEEEEKNKKST
ncbi:MAG: hypothetical protein FWD89_02020 [Firmicutes bacterium]|nr:hypothetical protein [Bacillota bacterium]